MKKKWIENFQGLAALVLAGVAFYGSTKLLPFLDPTMGTYDGGFAQRVFVAAFYYFSAVFSMWVVFQMDFNVFDGWIDVGKFREAWNSINDPKWQITVVITVVFMLLAAFLFCLWITPV